MNIAVDIQTACKEAVPSNADIRRWVGAALNGRCDEAEVSLRLVGEGEMRDLNRRYRDGRKATNVLSFPAQLPENVDHPLLGDIVVCPAVVEREAGEQGKTVEQHWAHMLVHGSLHLLGHDHVEAAAARDMESLETDIMASLGFPCPYDSGEATATQRSQSND